MLLQEREEGHLPRDVDTESLSLVVSRQNLALHVEVSSIGHFHFFAINLLIRLISTYVLVSLQIDARPLLRDEVRVLSPRYSNLLNDDRKLYVLLLFVSILQRNFRFN